MSDPRSYAESSTDELMARLQAADVEVRVTPWGPERAEVSLVFWGQGITLREALLDALAICREVTK